MVSGSNDRTIKLWDVKTGKEILTLPGHYDAFVESVSFSPDGKTLASGSDDDTIKLWDVKTGNEIRTLKGHDSSVKSVSFSPDGKTLASGSADGTVKFWKVEKDKEIRLLKEDYGSVESISFSPDSNTLASGGDDGTIKLWDLKTEQAIQILNLGRGISGFIVPEHYELYGTETRIDNSGNRIISPNNCLWLTNLDNFKRHEDIKLTKRYFGNEFQYPKYDNYDGININKTQDIPIDYKGYRHQILIGDQLFLCYDRGESQDWCSSSFPVLPIFINEDTKNKHFPFFPL